MALKLHELVERARDDGPYMAPDGSYDGARYLRSYRARLALGWDLKRPLLSQRERREKKREYHRNYQRRRRAAMKGV